MRMYSSQFVLVKSVVFNSIAFLETQCLMSILSVYLLIYATCMSFLIAFYSVSASALLSNSAIRGLFFKYCACFMVRKQKTALGRPLHQHIITNEHANEYCCSYGASGLNPTAPLGSQRIGLTSFMVLFGSYHS